MVGNSTLGNAATGRNRYATAPTRKIPTESRMVAIGRRMKGNEKFSGILHSPRDRWRRSRLENADSTRASGVSPAAGHRADQRSIIDRFPPDELCRRSLLALDVERGDDG